jgi:hypothetical protein
MAKVPSREGRWLLKLYPGAAEAGGCFESAARHSGSGSWWEPDPEPDPERCASETARRARGQLRRYCAENRLNHLWTLTYAPPFCLDPLVLRRDVRAFFRRLRSKAARDLPYAWVPELHADRERYHVHFAVGQYVKHGWIKRAWGHGIVNVKLICDLPVGSGPREEARIAGRYLAKYVGKEFGGRTSGLHRYEVAQGFQPPSRRLVGDTLGDVLAQAAAVMGRFPDVVWDSASDPGWTGPHAVWMSWDR